MSSYETVYEDHDKDCYIGVAVSLNGEIHLSMGNASGRCKMFMDVDETGRLIDGLLDATEIVLSLEIERDTPTEWLAFNSSGELIVVPV